METTRSRTTIFLAIAASFCLGAGPSGDAGGEQPEPKRVEADPPAESVVYRPPRLGSPRAKVGGGVRGARALPTPLALAPDHLALTRSPAPSLFWHLDAVASEDPDLRFTFTLIESQGIEPLLELDLTPPTRAGIQRIRLDAHGIELARDTEYEWAVSLVPDPERRAQDVVSQGFVMRVAEPDLGGRAPSAALYAERGFWYDALEILCDAIDAAPGDAALRAARGSLLRQAHLEAAID